MNLLSKKCIPCEGGTEPKTDEEVTRLLSELTLPWQVTDEPESRLRHEFRFKSFREAMSFVQKVAEIAEKEGHHPDIAIHYNRVAIELWTHAIGGMSENDFIVAAKIEALEK